ncbi:MAG: hypothetical protein QOK39_2855 [Acidimicrobiaceae bacterium]|nr:hypothetical protein [Acidimicrobiaceae bacterium]
MSTRLVDAGTSFVATRLDRRSFLVRMTVAGSALSVAPVRYLLRPGSAYDAVCGPDATCDAGYTAMCCTVTGDNRCPPGTFAGGWWKADNASLCCGNARYYIDCNMVCGQVCPCHCAGGSCDQRKVCCNQFRYGQCNQAIACAGPIQCRVVTCTPPWLVNPNCSQDIRVDDATAQHSAPCLTSDCQSSPSPPPPARHPRKDLISVLLRILGLGR